MLAYAFRVLHSDGYARFMFDDFDDAQDLLAAILAKGVSNQLKRGIYKEYVPREDVLQAPKGKINISETFRLGARRSKSSLCQFDDFSENTYFNQILKSVAKKLAKSKSVKPERQKMLSKIILFFRTVDDIDIHEIQWSTIRYQRNNATYEMLINICYLAVQDLIVQENPAGFKGRKLDDNQSMSRLYEKFILEYYKRHYPELHPKAAHIPWNVDNDYIVLLPKMKSDITLTSGDRTLIIDAKYYGSSMQSDNRFDTKTMRSNHLYQMFAYVKNKDVTQSGNVSGMLLYAKTDEEISPDNTYQLSGNSIAVRTLDLNRPFVEISTQLDGIIASWLVA